MTLSTSYLRPWKSALISLLVLFSLLWAHLLPARAGSLTVSWDPVTSPNLGGYKIRYGTSTGSYTQTVDVGSASRWTIPSLQEGATYYLRVLAYDSNGLAGTPSEEVSSPVLAVSSAAVASVSGTSATVTWQTNKPADSRVEYGVTSSYGMTTPLDPNLATNHSQELGGLLPGTTYHFRVVSVDEGGSVAVSGNFTFTTSATLSLNSGGPAVEGFAADRYASSGESYSVPDSIDRSGVVQPAPEAVYQTERWGPGFSYTIPNLVAGAPYLVRLHFAEIYWNGPGQRRFNVAINGSPVLTQFDIYSAAGGQDKALVREFSAVADPGGRIVIQYTQGSADMPKSSGIEILPASAGFPSNIDINAGGPEVAGFRADALYNGGTAHEVVGTVDTSGVAGAAPASLYLTGRSGSSFSYVFPNLVPGDLYSVRLHFTEAFWSSPGNRKFHVAINGSQALSNFDILAEAGGAMKALVKPFTAPADSAGKVSIQFSTGSADVPTVSGLSVAPLQFVSAINSGGSDVATFKADQNVTGGATGATGSSIDLSAVGSQVPQAVYQTERYGEFTYTIPGLSPGEIYLVRLHFAEINFNKAGHRRFNVWINGMLVLSNFDVLATAGAKNKAIVQQFAVPANAEGRIVIQYAKGSRNWPKSSGIEILK
ncbi:MAG: malectin domain-containing carbohydrate-binding protein [Acidobacteriota bacterium]